MSYDNEKINKKVEEAKMFFNSQVLDIIGKSNITQNKISHISGMAHQNVSSSLRRQSSTLRTLCRIANALGYKIKIILEKDDDA